MKKNLSFGTSGDAIFLTMIKLVTMVLGFVITRLLSQYLSVYDYGTYSQILLIVSTLSSVTILGMMDGVNFFYCCERDEQTRERYISSIFALQCIVSTVTGSIVLLLSGPLCQYLNNPDLEKLLIYAVALPFLQNLLNMFQVLLVAVGKARLLAIRNLIVSLVRLASAILVVSIIQDVSVVLITTVLLDVGQLAFFGWTLRKNHCVIRLKRASFKLFKRILEYCIPMAVFIAIRAVNRDVDKYMIALLTDTETLAVYANASKVLPFDIIVSSFYTVLVPEITSRVTSGNRDGAVSLYKTFLEICYITTLIFCCAALAASPQLMKLLYSNKYMSGLPVFCIYIFVDMLYFTNITLILSAAGRTKTLMALGIGTLCMNVVLNAVVYRWMGLIGPAVVTLLLTLLMGVVMLCLSAGELGVSVGRFFDIRFFCLFVLQNVLATAVLFKLQQWLDKMNVHYFVILILIAGLYCGIFLLIYGKRLMLRFREINTEAKKSA